MATATETARPLDDVLAGLEQLTADELRQELERTAARDAALRVLLRARLASDRVTEATE